MKKKEYKNKQQPDQRKARAEPNNGNMPNPGQAIKGSSGSKNKDE